MLERDDIQGLVLRAYRMPWAAYLFFRFTGAASARAWLGATADPLTTAAEWDEKPAWCANLGLTHPGLAALGLPPRASPAFRTTSARAWPRVPPSRLGDTGEDLPEHWEASPPFADAGRARRAARLGAQPRTSSTPGSTPSPGSPQRTGSSRSASSGRPRSARPGVRPGALRFPRRHLAAHAAGQRSRGRPARGPTGGGARRVRPRLRRRARATGRRSSLRSSGATAPTRCTASCANTWLRSAQWRGSRDDGDLLAAKLMGRWPSGAPVALAPARPTTRPSPRTRCAVNRFDYEADPLGFACPRGAHIRRARPRDGNPANRAPAAAPSRSALRRRAARRRPGRRRARARRVLPQRQHRAPVRVRAAQVDQLGAVRRAGRRVRPGHRLRGPGLHLAATNRPAPLRATSRASSPSAEASTSSSPASPPCATSPIRPTSEASTSCGDRAHLRLL